MTLSAFRSRGAERIGHVHGRNTRVFDLAGAAQRAGKAIPAFVSMRSLIDAGPAALDQARRLFDEYGKDDEFSENVADVEILAPIPRAATNETLMPGEFIGSGTVGNGCGLELGWYLEHGDTVELEVEKIGVLKNRVERQDA